MDVTQKKVKNNQKHKKTGETAKIIRKSTMTPSSIFLKTDIFLKMVMNKTQKIEINQEIKWKKQS